MQQVYKTIVLIIVGALTDTDQPLLVPLTTSLYVSGALADKDRVMIDVGTGYFLEKVRGVVTLR